MTPQGVPVVEVYALCGITPVQLLHVVIGHIVIVQQPLSQTERTHQ